MGVPPLPAARPRLRRRCAPAVGPPCGTATGFPALVNPTKAGREADPFVVAMALLLEEAGGMFAPTVVVVSQEKQNPGKVKIPDACKHYGIEHLRARDIVVREDCHF